MSLWWGHYRQPSPLYHPNTHAEFRAGKFVVHKTRNKFSAMAIDQCHEQNNGTVRKVETIGQEQYSKFVDERLSKCVTPVSDPLSKNKLPLFSRPAVKAPSKGLLQLPSMKSDCNLFAQIYLPCHARDGDVDQFLLTLPSISIWQILYICQQGKTHCQWKLMEKSYYQPGSDLCK